MLHKFLHSLFGLGRNAALQAYQDAWIAHASAIKRGDTRAIHDTRQALQTAMTQRLRVGA